MGKIEEVKYIIDNKKVTARNGKVQDAEKLINLIKKVGEETDFLLKNPDEFNPTVKEEEKFIQSQIL